MLMDDGEWESGVGTRRGRVSRGQRTLQPRKGFAATGPMKKADFAKRTQVPQSQGVSRPIHVQHNIIYAACRMVLQNEAKRSDGRGWSGDVVAWRRCYAGGGEASSL